MSVALKSVRHTTHWIGWQPFKKGASGGARFPPLAAGLFLGWGFGLRRYRLVVGGKHARQIFWIPFWSLSWWKEIFDEIRWYLFIGKPKEYVGHNPLAHNRAIAGETSTRIVANYLRGRLPAIVDSYTNVVDVAIRRLRKKVDDPFELKLIHTIRGVGYVLDEAE